MNKRRQLIDQLAGDLQPVRRLPSVAVMVAAWLVFLAASVVIAINLSGPVRPGAYSDAVTHGQFSLELLLGVLSIGTAAMFGVESSIPGRPRRAMALVLGLLLAVWLACYAVGFSSPALATGMLGKREHCYIESLLFGLPAMAAGWWLMRRLYPLRPLRSTAAMGVAAGLAPGLYMQLACMYDPTHALLFHYLPGLVAAALFTLAVWVSRRRG